MMAGRGTEFPSAGGPARHIPVMLSEALEALSPESGETIIDGTFGAGGYTRALLEATGCNVIAIDRDPEAIAGGASLKREFGDRLTLVTGRYADMESIARAAGIEAIDGVALDLGVSSMQLDQAERGFSFMQDGPLDMRMGKDGPTAADIVNTFDEKDLAAILSGLGEEKRARAIGRAIVARRSEQPILRTHELADVVVGVLGRRYNDPKHPATRTFQALRLYVNGELEELGRGLAAAERLLKAGGRLVVVTFHSLEDRIVKRFFASRSTAAPKGSRHFPDRTAPPPSFRLVNRHALSPSEGEIRDNPRARSARLRAGVRLDAPVHPLDLAELGMPRISLAL